MRAPASPLELPVARESQVVSACSQQQGWACASAAGPEQAAQPRCAMSGIFRCSASARLARPGRQHGSGRPAAPARTLLSSSLFPAGQLTADRVWGQGQGHGAAACPGKRAEHACSCCSAALSLAGSARSSAHQPQDHSLLPRSRRCGHWASEHTLQHTHGISFSFQ